METLKAFHNDVAVKKKYIKRVKAHRIADKLIKGKTWENGKGCAIGCTLEAYDHSLYPIELGIPEMIARFEDCIFEGLPNGKSQEWPERFLKAINVGADLSRVGPKMLLAIVKRRHESLDTKGKALVGSAIEQVIKVLADWVEFGKVDIKAAKQLMIFESAAEYKWMYEWMADKLIELIKKCK